MFNLVPRHAGKGEVEIQFLIRIQVVVSGPVSRTSRCILGIH